MMLDALEEGVKQPKQLSPVPKAVPIQSASNLIVSSVSLTSGHSMPLQSPTLNPIPISRNTASQFSQNRWNSSKSDKSLQAPLFGFKRLMGPYQSSGHIVKDNEDRFIEIQCSDNPFIQGHFGMEAVNKGKRAITASLWDEEGFQLHELQVIAGTCMVICDFSQDSVTIKPKLPNLGATSHTLYLFIELHLLFQHQLTSYAGEWFPFQRFHHLNELPPEELKKLERE